MDGPQCSSQGTVSPCCQRGSLPNASTEGLTYACDGVYIRTVSSQDPEKHLSDTYYDIFGSFWIAISNFNAPRALLPTSAGGLMHIVHSRLHFPKDFPRPVVLQLINFGSSQKQTCYYDDDCPSCTLLGFCGFLCGGLSTSTTLLGRCSANFAHRVVPPFHHHD